MTHRSGCVANFRDSRGRALTVWRQGDRFDHDCGAEAEAPGEDIASLARRKAWQELSIENLERHLVEAEHLLAKVETEGRPQHLEVLTLRKHVNDLRHQLELAKLEKEIVEGPGEVSP